jgi:hypothetical protein
MLKSYLVQRLDSSREEGFICGSKPQPPRTLIKKNPVAFATG